MRFRGAPTVLARGISKSPSTHDHPCSQIRAIEAAFVPKADFAEWDGRLSALFSIFSRMVNRLPLVTA
jgi:hypothetical protein